MITPYYADEAVTLYCGRFEDLLPDVLAQHGEPDLTLTDPPYGETSLAWDRWPDGWPSLIPGRSMWVFGSMRMFLDRRDEFAGWRLSQDAVWQKNTGSSFVTDRLKRIHEHAVHWYRGPWVDVHHVPPRVAYDGPRKTAGKRHAQRQHNRRVDNEWTDDGTRQLTSVLYAPNLNGRAVSETEKPVGVVEPLVEYGCPPGGLVLDVFAGSCSTLVAARNSGRRGVGIELREEQCAKAVEWRLSQAVLPLAVGGAPDA